MGMSYEITDRMNERCRETLAFMKGCPLVCTSDLVAEFGWHLNHVAAVIRWLKDDGYIKELPKKLNRVWYTRINESDWVERAFSKSSRSYVRKEKEVVYQWQDNPFLASFMGYQSKPQRQGRRVDNSMTKTSGGGQYAKFGGTFGVSGIYGEG